MKKLFFGVLLVSFILLAGCDLLSFLDEEFTVTFDTNGGSAVADQTVEDGEVITKPDNPSKEGNEFAGWYSDAGLTDAWDFTNDTVSEDITLYAKWSLASYTVSFDTKEGSAVTDQTIAYGDTVTEPDDPTKDGYIFSGWYTEEELTNAWDFTNDAVSEDMTLFVKWEGPDHAFLEGPWHNVVNSYEDDDNDGIRETVIDAMNFINDFSNDNQLRLYIEEAGGELAVDDIHILSPRIVVYEMDGVFYLLEPVNENLVAVTGHESKPSGPYLVNNDGSFNTSDGQLDNLLEIFTKETFELANDVPYQISGTAFGDGAYWISISYYGQIADDSLTAYQNYPENFDKPIFQGEFGEFGYMKGVVQEYSNVDNTMIIEWDVHPAYDTGSFSRIEWNDTPDPPTNDPISFTTYENKPNIADAKNTNTEDTNGSMVIQLYAGESTPE